MKADFIKRVFIGILFLPLWLFSAEATAQLSPQEKRWIKTHPMISVANDPQWAPFDFTKDGKAQGIGIDYIELVAKKVGLKVNYVQAPWSELFERFKLRNIDIVHSVYKTRDREKFALFSEPFYDNTNAIVTRKGVTISSLKDFEDKRIALIKGHGLSETLFKELHTILPIEVNDLKEGLHAVSFAKADAVVSSLSAISYSIMKEALPNLNIAPFDLFDKEVNSQLYFATTPNQPILRDILNKGLDAITPQEETAIRSRWLLQSNTNLSILTDISLKEQKWLQEHPVIRFTGRSDYLPYEAFQEDGTYIGAMSENLTMIEKKTGVLFEKNPSNSLEEIDEKVKNKQVDVFTTLKGNHSYDATHIQIQTDIKSPVIIVGKKHLGDHFIPNLSKLTNEQVAIVKSAPYADQIKEQYPNIHYVYVKDMQTAYEDVASGKYTYMISSLALASRKFNELSIHNLQIVGNTGYVLELYLSVPKEWPIFAEIIKRYFEEHSREIDISNDESMYRWENITLKPTMDYTILIESIGIFIALILLLFYWNHLLKKKVAQKTAQFATLLKTFDTHVIASRTDLEGNITYVSDAFCTISGYQRNELIGFNHRIVKHPDNPASVYRDLWRTIKQGATWQGRIKNRKKQGGFYWIDSLIKQESNMNNTPIGYVAIMRDATAQVALEELSKTLEHNVKERTQELAKLNQEQQAIFDTALIGIVLLQERIIINGNHYLNEMFGYNQGEQIGQSTKIWYQDEATWMNSGNKIYNALHSNKIQSQEQRLKRKDGTFFWARITLKEIDPTNTKTGIVGVIEDITFEKEALEEIQRAKTVAEEATKTKSNFLANMSHEIRTPMNAITGMAHLMFQTSLNPKQHNYLEKIDNAAKHLLQIINDILDFSKIESGKMTFEEIDFYLEDVMEQLSDLLVIKAQEKGLEILFDVGLDVPTALRGDPLRLGQVLINLVNNAVKFTQIGEIKIAIHVKEQSENDVILLFEISDTGIGMSQDEQEKLFQAFSQVDVSTTRKYGGSGLGLVISKHLVETMQGSIGATSRLGKGSTFFFDAMFKLQKEQKHIELNEEEVRNLRILIVDDNQSSRTILENILKSFKFEVSSVENGYEAIAVLKEAYACDKPYGLVLMDWMMPDMNGIETIQKIRETSEIASTLTFIMITSYSKEDLKHELEKSQINSILIKPINPSTLLNTIFSALGREVVIQSRHRDKKILNDDALRSLKNASILLVEDNLINQEMAMEILEKAGLNVDIANNGYEAVLKIQNKAYDGILMDCQMPVMDGFEATRIIRQDQKNHSLPIIAMTANAMSGDKERCIASGMDDHIAKPIDIAQLFSTMAKHIKPSTITIDLLPEETIQTEELITIPNLFGINATEALLHVNNDTKMFLKLLIRFAQTQKSVIERMQNALKNADTTVAKREAHTLKGLAGTIGATLLATQAERLETCLTKVPNENCDDLLEDTRRIVDRICTDIEQKCALFEANVFNTILPMTYDPIELLSQCEHLKQLLDSLAPEAGEFFETFLPKLQTLGYESELLTLHEQIQNFNYDEAKAIIEGIEKALSSR